LPSSKPVEKNLYYPIAYLLSISHNHPSLPDILMSASSKSTNRLTPTTSIDNDKHLRLLFANHILNSLSNHYNRRRLTKYFTIWHIYSDHHQQLASLRHQSLKIGSEWTKIHAEKLKHAQMETDNKRRLAEKLCLMYLMKQKQKSADAEVARIRSTAEKEKEDLVRSLRAMYQQLSKLNVLEEQAVSAAKSRGEVHLSSLESTATTLSGSEVKWGGKK